MNKTQTRQYTTFVPVMENNFEFKKFESGTELIFECRKCNHNHVFNTRQLKSYAANGSPECCMCSLRTPTGFTIANKDEIVTANKVGVEKPSHRILECSDCGLQYHREKSSSYFRCFCTLGNKLAEHELYRLLAQGYSRGRTCNNCKTEVKFLLSREESLLGDEAQPHKVDIKITRKKCCDASIEREIYVEVDGQSHYATRQKVLDREQEEFFLENRKETDFLYRIRESYIYNPYILENFFNEILEDPGENTQTTDQIRYWGKAGLQKI